MATVGCRTRLAFSRTGRRNLNGGKVDADDEASKTVEPGVSLERWVSWTDVQDLRWRAAVK